MKCSPILVFPCVALFGLCCLPRLLADDSASSAWRPLFDGKTLNGWEILEDQGKFFVEDGAVVGETVRGGGSSYLCTNEAFSNFVLEVDFKVDEGSNSGVQI